MANTAFRNIDAPASPIGRLLQNRRNLLIPIAWILVAVVAVAVAVEASARYPVSSLEQQISIWPAHLDSATYLDRALVEPFFRWDALYHFMRLVMLGYQSNSAVLAFYPLYPMLARVFYLAGLNPAVSLLIVSWAAGIAYLSVFRRLAAMDLGARIALQATLLLLVFPMSLMLFVPYMESLFLLLACLTLYFARKKMWLAAGLASAFATLTKQPGILLVIPLAHELLLDRPPRRAGYWRGKAGWLALAIAPATMVLWTVFRSYTWDPGFVVSGTVPQIILRALVSSSAGEMVVSRPFDWPWQIITQAVHEASADPAVRLHVLFNLGGYFAIVLMLMAGWRSLRPSYRLYALCVLIFTLLDYAYNQNAQPLTSMFRHAYLAFPVFLALPGLLRHRLSRRLYAALGMSFFIILLYAYVMRAWII